MAAKLQYSNGNVLLILLVLMSSTCFLVGSPSHKLWNWMKHWNLTSCFIFLSMALFSTCTDRTAVECKKKNLKEIPPKEKKISLIANFGLIAIAITTQFVLWKWNYNIRYSFPLFVLSNMIMGIVYITMLFKTMFHAVGRYKHKYAAKEFTYAIAGSCYSYVQSNSYGDNWLYHLYFTAIIYICAMEIFVLSTGNVWLNIDSKKECLTNVGYYSDNEDFEYISSDEEYEIVDKDGQVYQESEPISL